MFDEVLYVLTEPLYKIYSNFSHFLPYMQTMMWKPWLTLAMPSLSQFDMKRASLIIMPKVIDPIPINTQKWWVKSWMEPLALTSAASHKWKAFSDRRFLSKGKDCYFSHDQSSCTWEWVLYKWAFFPYSVFFQA